MLHAKATGRVDDELLRDLDEATDELKTGLAELRDLAQGIHPAVLTEAGLAAGLATLAERSPIATRVLAVPDRRLPAEVEATAYFVASEALANAAKHAAARRVTVAAELQGDDLTVTIRDDGVGGAATTGGTGLRGLRDRVEALGGDLAITSPRGEGTTIRATHPRGRGRRRRPSDVGNPPWRRLTMGRTIEAMRTILLVDDHAGFRRQARALLERSAFTVVGEAGGRPAPPSRRRRCSDPTSCCSTWACPVTTASRSLASLRARAEAPVVVLTSSRAATAYGDRIAGSAAAGFVRKDELTASTLAALVDGRP